MKSRTPSQIAFRAKYRNLFMSDDPVDFENACAEVFDMENYMGEFYECLQNIHSIKLDMTHKPTGRKQKLINVIRELVKIKKIANELQYRFSWIKKCAISNPRLIKKAKIRDSLHSS